MYFFLCASFFLVFLVFHSLLDFPPDSNLSSLLAVTASSLAAEDQCTAILNGSATSADVTNLTHHDLPGYALFDTVMFFFPL